LGLGLGLGLALPLLGALPLPHAAGTSSVVVVVNAVVRRRGLLGRSRWLGLAVSSTISRVRVKVWVRVGSRARVRVGGWTLLRVHVEGQG